MNTYSFDKLLNDTSKNSFSMESTVTHRNSSSLKVANNVIISHFSILLLLGLARFHDRKPIFRGALKKDILIRN